MTRREQIEAEIWELLTTETRTAVLRNKLFQEEIGLFAQLGVVEEGFQELVNTELYRTAQARLRELDHRDAETFRETHHIAQEQLPDTDLRLNLDFPTLAVSPSGV